MRWVALALLAGCAESEPIDLMIGTLDAAPAADVAVPPDGCPTVEDGDTPLSCAALSRCEVVPIEFQLACCQCDPRYCRPEPACEPDLGTDVSVDAVVSDVSVTDGLTPDVRQADAMVPPMDTFASEVMPRLDARCTPCHAGVPNPESPAFSVYLGPANPPGSLTPEQIGANRTEVLSHVNEDDPLNSALLVRPTGQAHPNILVVGDADYGALRVWIESL